MKSRWATDYNKTFPIKNFDCDFVVLAALNRGFRYGKRRSSESGRRSPQLYVFPVGVVQEARKPESRWGIVPLRNISGIERYRDAWRLIADFLELERLAEPSSSL